MKSVTEDWNDCLRQLEKAAEGLQKASEAIKNALEKFSKVSEDKEC